MAQQKYQTHSRIFLGTKLHVVHNGPWSSNTVYVKTVGALLIRLLNVEVPTGCKALNCNWCLW
jgi:hypothetical protein